MPSWKKLIVSGSDASLSSLTATSYGGNISGSASSTGSFGVLKLDKFNGGIGASTNTLYGVDAGSSIDDSVTTETAIGYQALKDNATSGANTAVGSYALWQYNGSTGRNTAVGLKAGWNLTGGYRGTYIGWEAEAGGANNIGEIVIGYAVTGKGSNTAVIGGGNITDIYMSSDVGAKLHTGDVSGSAISTGSFGKLLGDGSEITGLTSAAISSYTNNGNNRIITSVDANTVNGEANLTFDGTTLAGATATTASFGILELDKYNIGIGHNSNTNFGIGAGSTGGGDANLAIGYNAGNFSNAGSSINIAIGWEAQGHWSDADGDRNIAIGYQAQYDHNGGDDNIAIGYQAMKNGEGSHNDNIAIGTDAMQAIGSGASRNIGMGDRVMHGLVGGTDNIGIGKDVLFSNQAGDYNVALGTEALYGINAESADKNVAIGYRAGIFITNGSTEFSDGDSNVFIGSETKPAADDESNQIIIGANAIGKGSNTALIGDDNITDIYMSEDLGATLHTGDVSGSAISTGSFGHLLVNGSVVGGSDSFSDGTATAISGSATSTGSFGQVDVAGNITANQVDVADIVHVNNLTIRGAGNNVAIGDDGTGESLTEGTYGSVAIGSHALSAHNGSNQNIAIGHNAMKERTAGSDTIAIGTGAGGLGSGDVGDKNVLLGVNVGYNLDGSASSANASQNVFIGYQSSDSATTGLKNTAVGAESGRGLVAGSSNVFLGYFAGTGGNTEGGTFLGEYTTTAGGTTNEIVIGNGAIGKGSHTVVLGDDRVTDIYMSEDVGATLHTGQIIASGSANATDTIKIYGNAAGNVGNAGITFDLDNSTDDAEAYLRLDRTSGTAYLGLTMQSDGRDGMRFMTGTTEHLRINGNDISGSGASVFSVGRLETAGNITPKVDDSVDLGAADKRFQNIFTTDLQLSNEGKEKGNEVDGTTGSWTIQEGEEELYLLNRKNGKKYKFMLQEIK